MLNQSFKHTKRWAMPIALLLTPFFLSGCGGSEAEAQAQVAEMQLAAHEATLADREQRLAEREAALAEQGLAATRLETVSERQRELDDRAGSLAARASRLGSREAALARQEAALAESETRLATERRTLTEARGAVERESTRQAEVARRNPPAVFTEIALATDTLLDIEFLSTVSSATSRVGDSFVTRLTEDLLAGDGRLVVPAGTELTGVVSEAVPLKRVGGQALLGLRFGELQLPWGKSVEINASFFDAGRDESRRDKKIIGGAAAGGAILGAIIDDGGAGGTILGAIIGAAAGTARAANRRGDEVVVPGGTVVTLQLDEPALVTVPWKSRYSEPAIARAGE